MTAVSPAARFHYDKDEAMASAHWTMSYPVLSTIMYLEDVGAPTFILNQTSPDGNVRPPPSPFSSCFNRT